MKKINKFLVSLSMVALLSVSAVSAANLTYDFDDFETVDFLAGSEDDVSILNTETLTFKRDTNARLSIAEAPAGKQSGTSLTEDGDTDKCLLLQNSLSSIQNSKMYVNIVSDAGNDRYIDTKKDIKISFNLKAGRTYTTTHDLGYVDIFGNTGETVRLINYEGVKSGPIKAVLLGTSIGTISDGWHYYEIVIHVADKAVEIKLDGEAVFENPVYIGDETIFNSESEEWFSKILFATNSTINKSDKTGDVLRIDDITVTNLEDPAEFTVSAPGVYANGEAVAAINTNTEAQAKVHVSVPAGMEEEKQVTLIAALYDQTGTLINVYLSDTKTYPALGEAAEEDIVLDIPAEYNQTGYFIKVFVWDSMSGMNKLSETIGTAEIVE